MKQRGEALAKWSRKIHFKNKGGSFFQNTIVRFSLIIGTLLHAAGLLILLAFVNPQQSSVILHYNVYFGVDVIGDRIQIFLLPSIATLFFVMNIFLAKWLYDSRKERIAGYVLLLTSIMIGLGLVLAVSSIAMINY